MTSRSQLGTRSGAIVGLAVLVGLVVSLVLACGASGTPTGATASAETPAGGASAAPSANPPPTVGPSPTVAGRDAPPEALLAAEGGDRVAGQLGTYVWFDSGSDAPWLPGAPLTVGAGEPLTVTLVPDDGVLAWAARFVPAAARGPEGATALGEGSGGPRFDAPGSGTWTVEVFMEFAVGAGNARYFWRLEVE